MNYSNTYFHKYSNPSWKGRRFWNSTGHGVLNFIVKLGLLLEGIQLIHYYLGLHAILPHLSFTFPPFLIGFCCVIVLLIAHSYYVFKAQNNKLFHEYDTEANLLTQSRILKDICNVFNKHNYPRPGNYNQDISKTLEPPSFVKRWKKAVTIGIESIIGSIGLATSIGNIFGVSVFGLSAFLGPLSPIMVLSVSILINLSLTIWLHGMLKGDIKFYHQVQERNLVEINHRIELLATSVENNNGLRECLILEGLISSSANSAMNNELIDSLYRERLRSTGSNRTSIESHVGGRYPYLPGVRRAVADQMVSQCCSEKNMEFTDKIICSKG